MKKLLFSILLLLLVIPLSSYAELQIDTLWQTTFSIDGIPIQINDIVYSGDGEWIAVGGGVVYSDTCVGIILRVNENGVFTDTLLLSGYAPKQVFVLENGDYILDGIEYDEDWRAIPTTARFNPRGEILWYRSRHSGYGGLLRTAEEQVTMLALIDTNQSYAYLHLNLDGEITDTVSLDLPDFTNFGILTQKLIGFRNNQVYLSGSIDYYWGGPGFIISTSLTGEILWEYIDSTDGFEEVRHYNDIILLEDETIVVGTVYYDLGGWFGIILKFNEAGDLRWTTQVDIRLSAFNEVIYAGNGNSLAVGTRAAFPYYLERNIDCVALFNDEGDIIDDASFQDSAGWEPWGAKLNCIATNEDTSAFITGGNLSGSALLVRLAIEEQATKNFHIPSIPNQITLSPPYPNPFNSTARIQYSLPHPLSMRITVTNILGKLILEQNYGIQPAGSNQIFLNSKGFSSGVYIINLETSQGTVSRRMTVLK
ncbi:T9SS type A sorting domain-containing protein [Calditrichota bacterium]